MKDYYKILELTYPSNEKEIKSSYRRLVKLYHPDTNKSEGADEKIKEINEAYSTLSDKNKKAEYDNTLYSQNRGGRYKPSDWSNMWESKTDSFDEFIKKNSNRYWNTNRNSRRDFWDDSRWDEVVEDHYGYNQKYETAPSNIKIKLPITVNDTLQGKIKTLTYKRKIVCECVKNKTYDCRICNDTGLTQQEFTTKIQIPKGVYKGSEILYKEFGNEGYNPNKFGNLHIVISDITSSQDFKLDENQNVVENVSINIEDILKGTTLKLKSVLGEYEQKINPYEIFKNNLKMTIDNIGIIKNSTGSRTSHIVNIKVNEPSLEFLEYIKDYKKENSTITEEENG